MLVLRAPQLEVLAAEVQKRFEARLAEELKVQYPQAAAMDGEALQALIQSGVKRARANGFRANGELSLFVKLLLVHGAEYDTDPSGWAAPILESPLATPHKVALLKQHLEQGTVR